MFLYYFDLALRSFRSARGLTALMVLTIAMGIGASMTTLTTFRALSGDPIPGNSANVLRVQLDAQPKATFTPGKDEIIRKAPANGGYVVSFGDTLYRALDAVTTLQEEGVPVGLVNKSTLNVMDRETMKILAGAKFVLVAEPFNVATGLGSRFGTELLKLGFKGAYNNIGVHKEGCGGLWQQVVHQGIDPAGIAQAVRKLM